jgi:putative intracellular protease/amidase
VSDSMGLRVVAVAVAVSCATFASAAPVAPTPKKVAILLFEGVQMIDYSGPYEVFADAGYEVFTVAENKRPLTTANGDGEKVIPKYTFADAPQADIVVIPGGNFEADRDTATTAWVKRENAQDQHTLSVCNGAFTLANTGLLDGLSATTTAANILRMKRTYPQINVVSDQRVVDNGKIITTAGLSAGIDGALHLVEVMDGKEAAQSVALTIEYNWQPNSAYVRGVMADRLIPYFDSRPFGEDVADRVQGDKDHWDTITWVKSKMSAAELFSGVQGAYEKAYALPGSWKAGSFHLAPAGAQKANLSFEDQEGHRWQGALTLEPAAADPHQYVVRLTTARAT